MTIPTLYLYITYIKIYVLKKYSIIQKCRFSSKVNSIGTPAERRRPIQTRSFELDVVNDDSTIKGIKRGKCFFFYFYSVLWKMLNHIT